MFHTNTMQQPKPGIFSVHLRGWLTLFLLILAALLAGCSNTVSTEDKAAATAGAATGNQNSNAFLIVDCLLPGQVKKLGGNFTYITQRRPIKTSASDCEIRGGEYVAYDRSNYSTALKIWLPLAKEGDARAQSYVGEIYEKGLGLEPDYQLAAHWYKLAADQGYSRAQINLGHLYEMGLGVPADQQIALNYYRQASGIRDDRLLFASTLNSDYVTRSKYETVKDKLSEQRQKTAQLQRQVESVSATLKAQNSALGSAQQQLSATQDQLQQLIAKQASTQTKPHTDDTKWLSQIRQLEEQRQLLEQEITQLNRRNEILQQDQSRMQQQVAAAAQSRLENQRRLSKLQNDLESSRQQLKVFQDSMAQAKSALASAQAETATITPQISQLQNELQRKADAVKQQQQAYDALRKESTRQQQLLEQSIDELARKTAQLESKTAQLDRDRSTLEATLNESNSQSAELQRQLLLSRAALEIEKTKRQQALAAQDEAHQAQLAERQAALLALSERLERQTSLVGDQKQRIQALESQSARYREELAKARQAQAQQLASADIPPRIEIIEPPVVLTRSIPTVQLAATQNAREIIGKVSAPAGLMSLIVNGESVTPQSNNLFRSNIAIKGDETPVDIVAIDNQGRRAALNFSFVTDGGKQADSAAASLNPLEVKPRKKKTFKVNWEMGDYHALIIGNNEYRHLSTLVTAVNDARETDELLRTKYKFKTRLLLNADRYQILSALNELRETLREQDNLLIYYAGHGKMDEVNDRGYWLPVDAEANNSANWISNTAITDILNAIPAKHILVVADSCYSGTLAPTPLARMDSEIPSEIRQEWVKVMSDTRARITLTSGGLEPVLDGGGGDHSVFAKAFIEALSENDQLLEGYSLYAQVLDKMTANPLLVAQADTPQYSPIHLAGHESGEFFFNPF